MKIRIDAGGISFTANEEQVREPILMNAERIPLKLEIWIYKAMVEKLSKARECELTFDLDGDIKKAWYIPTVTPNIDGDYQMVEFEKYNKPVEEIIEENRENKNTEQDVEKLRKDLFESGVVLATEDNKILDLNNLPKLEVKDGMVYLDEMALTSLQKIGIKHDVTGDRITRLNIELLVDFEGLI